MPRHSVVRGVEMTALIWARTGQAKLWAKPFIKGGRGWFWTVTL